MHLGVRGDVAISRLHEKGGVVRFATFSIIVRGTCQHGNLNLLHKTLEALSTLGLQTQVTGQRSFGPDQQVGTLSDRFTA